MLIIKKQNLLCHLCQHLNPLQLRNINTTLNLIKINIDIEGSEVLFKHNPMICTYMRNQSPEKENHIISNMFNINCQKDIITLNLNKMKEKYFK